MREDRTAGQKITKRVIDRLRARPREHEHAVWDAQMPGFGVRVRPTGAMSYVVVYRAGAGRGAPFRRFTIGAVGQITPEAARTRARAILGAVAQGKDPAADKAGEREMPTVTELADRFIAEHLETKRKRGTAAAYRHVLDAYVKPALGSTKADKLTRAAVGKLHDKLSAKPFQANRMLATVSSMYSFAERAGIVPEGMNPARKIVRFAEHRRERFLTGEELERLGAAIREAETTGIPFEINETAPKAKHAPKSKNRFTKIGKHAAAALRLLLFTGARLREILHLKWDQVDLERGMLFLPDSKTGKKSIILNAPALAILATLPRVGAYVIAGDTAGSQDEKPRADLKRPWQAIAKRAGLGTFAASKGKGKRPRWTGVRLNDLRHTHASFGAGGGLGLPIIGKLLGHKNPATTARYAHLDNDPVRRASERIGSNLAAAMGEAPSKGGEIVQLNRRS
jgi:integrase